MQKSFNKAFDLMQRNGVDRKYSTPFLRSSELKPKKSDIKNTKQRKISVTTWRYNIFESANENKLGKKI